VAVRKIGIQAGHGSSDSGALSCDRQAREASITAAIADQVVQYLKSRLSSRGYQVERYSGADGMQGYKAATFVALHADWCPDPSNPSIPTGYKVARYGGAKGSGLNGSGDASDRLASAVWNEYGRTTSLPQDRSTGHFTDNMLFYYALGNLDPATPGAIIEMGWLSGDLDFLLHQQDRAAIGIANGILAFLGEPTISYQVLHQTSASIAQGQTSPAQTVNVPAGQERLAMNLTWPGSALDLTLIDPKGQKVGLDYPGATWTISAKQVSVVVTNPQPGDWRTEIFGRDVPEGTLTYQLSAAGIRGLAGPGRSAETSTNAVMVLLLIIMVAAVLGGAALFAQNRAPAHAGGPYLQVSRGQAARQFLPLRGSVVTLGRDPRSSLVLADPQVSRHHAQISRTPQGYYITDLGSASGLYVNGQPYKQKGLQPGDVIRLGDTELVFQAPVGRPASVAPVRSTDSSSTAWLVLGGRRHPIPASGVIIGRDPRCAVAVSDPHLSRQHARIVPGPAGYVIQNLSSAGVTYVNGQPVTQATLRGGEVIRVGNTEMAFQMEQKTS
jgi:pSer/pThr/pTyr-binding forkhead associated (FHA) protein/N-acetylmuramoyl-L-alanine amidase